MPERVVTFAQGMVSRLESDFHELLAELKAERKKYEDAVADLEQRSCVIAEQERRLKERLAALDVQKREMQEKSLMDARELIQQAKREVGAILEEARREKSRTAKERLRTAEEVVDARIRELHPETQVSIDSINVGDAVFVRSIGYDGRVVAVDRKQGRLRVRAGIMEMEVASADVSPRTGKVATPGKASRPVEGVEVPNQLNLVGSRVDDALAELERYLNHASLEGIGEVRIIHGRGTGALMRGIRDYLEGHPLTQGFRSGEQFEGGDGVTVVTLR
jgi:DNA mismatch repair protein MutS2